MLIDGSYEELPLCSLPQTTVVHVRTRRFGIPRQLLWPAGQN